jgi:predicted ATPase
MYIDYLKIDWSKVDEGSYLRNLGSLKKLKRFDFASPITFFVGENGTGKSTLLEAIALGYGFNAEGGTLNYRFSTFASCSSLSDALILGKGPKARKGFFLRAESFYNLATKTIEYEKEYGRIMYGDKTLHEQSHGESFLNFIETFQSKGLYLMDEPEAALSPQRQLSLLSTIASMAKDGSQYIIVTHSPILLAIPGTDIVCFDESGLVRQEYEETLSYRLTEMIINHRKAVIPRLIGDED